jgi:glycosyltransferase involved in cell wall biosynthesis
VHYLTACAIYMNEGPFLQEWIEFHRIVGVEKFFLYNNMSTDDHRAILKPYVDDDTVALKDWPDKPGQSSAYQDCLEEQRDAARWIAFIDLDEFLFSPTLIPLPEILEPYEQWPGVSVNWANFGPSGHETRPEGLVLENYLLRALDSYHFNRMFKCVVDPQRTIRMRNPHCFEYSEGFSVDEKFRPRDQPPRGMTETASFSRLRLNHYYMKSKEQWFAKLETPHAHSGALRNFSPEGYAPMAQRLSLVRDQTITVYVPTVRAEIAARGKAPVQP